MPLGEGANPRVNDAQIPTTSRNTHHAHFLPSDVLHKISDHRNSMVGIK